MARIKRNEKSAAYQVWISKPLADFIAAMMDRIAEEYSAVSKSEFINDILTAGIREDTLRKWGGKEVFGELDLDSIGLDWEQVEDRHGRSDS